MLLFMYYNGIMYIDILKVYKLKQNIEILVATLIETYIEMYTQEKCKFTYGY